MDITSYLMGKKQGGGGTTINNQDKTVTENGEYTADSGYTGLGTVTVNVPQPSGTINITENGTYDVTDKSSAVVNVSGGTPTNLPELRIFGNTFQTNYLETIPSNRNTYTDQAITLYTPSSGRTHYAILKKPDGYCAVWYSQITRFENSRFYFTGLYLPEEKLNENIFGIKYADKNGCNYSETISSLEELITKMQTPNALTYTYYRTNPYISYDGTEQEACPYSNSVIIDSSLGFYNTGVLSYNETISVQS